jgi:hypothetical protein
MGFRAQGTNRRVTILGREGMNGSPPVAQTERPPITSIRLSNRCCSCWKGLRLWRSVAKEAAVKIRS